MPLEEIRKLVADDLRRVDQVVVARLASEVALVNQVAQYIVAGGGKRLRPLCVLLAARACGYTGAQHVEAAAVIEFIHTATLLHDDVVDGSDLRRGRETSNHVWGNPASVLVGDYLYSRAFQMMVGLGDMRIQEVMANATNTIAEGEVLQLMNAHDPDTTEKRYLDVIYRKTAKLFEAGAQVAAITRALDAGNRAGHGRLRATSRDGVPARRRCARLPRRSRRAGQEPGRRPGGGQGHAAPDPRDGELVARTTPHGCARPWKRAGSRTSIASPA